MNKYRLIDKDGKTVCHPSGMPIGFMTVQRAAQYARDLWPGQEQDEDRSGKGWDVEVIPSTD